MVSKPAIAVHRSPNQRPEVRGRKHYAVVHWMVGFLLGTRQVFSRPSYRVATNYGVGPGAIDEYVPMDTYAMGSGTYAANRDGISIEHEGGYLRDGVRVPPSRETLDRSAHLLAWLSQQNGWGKLELGRNVRLHHNFVNTSCPGTTDVGYLIAKANEILGQGAAPTAPVQTAPAAAPASSGRPALRRGSTGTYVQQAQTRLRAHGHSLVVDGIFGAQTEAAVRAFQKARGLAVDGVIGTAQTWPALLSGAGTASVGRIVVDGKFGPQTITRLQKVLGQKQDGDFGPVSRKALQRHLGQKQDGDIGEVTISALQRKVSAKVDGKWGIASRVPPPGEKSQTTERLQQALNAGRF